MTETDNILTNLLTSNSHNTKTVLSVDVWIQMIDWSLCHCCSFRVSMCYYRCLLCFFVFFFNFLPSCNSLLMSYYIKGYL